MKKLTVFIVTCSIILLCNSCQENNVPFEGHIGQIKDLHELHPAIDNIVGIAFQDDKKGQFMYIFEGISGKLHRLKVDKKTGNPVYMDHILIEGMELENPRGLAYAREVSGDVFYFLDYVMFQDNQRFGQKGILYRFDVDNDDITHVDLNTDDYEIETNEVFGVTKQGGNLYVSFDPSGYSSLTMRVRRGLLNISVNDNKSVIIEKNGQTIKRPYEWEEACAGRPVIKGHIPGPGKEIKPANTHPYASFSDLRVEPSRALADMTIDGTEYLWGTVGNDYIYLIDSHSGRGLFFFDRPKGSAHTFYDMIAYGAGDLWVADKIDDTYFVYRVNVLDNPNLPYEGPKRYRELKLQITSNVADNVDTPEGYVYHTFCHPYDSDVTGNQGIIPNSIRVNDLTGIPDCKIEQLYFDPAGDPGVRQHYTLVTYPTDNHPEVRKYVTEFYVKLWKRDLKYFVYPHLVSKDSGLEGTRYLEDDKVLYNIESDPSIYEGFINRVKDYIAEEYNIEPDMENPYWASRNILEYVMENYHYPIDSAGYWATYDFENGHYNSHPGDLKAALSADDNYEDNIIACSGAGCMITGLLRYIGIPSIWVGTSNEAYLKDGFLGMDHEGAKQINGHRYNHVWFNDFYGWQRFDATPMMPVDINAYHNKPQKVSQWIFMQRAAGSTVNSKRVIHNLQSEYWEKMHITCRNAYMDNINNYGAVRYNLLGSYTNPELFDFSGYDIGGSHETHLLRARGIQFIENVNVVVDEESLATVTWQKAGEWELDSEAKFMIVLEKKCLPGEDCFPGYRKMDILATDITINQKIIAVNLSKYDEGTYRMIVAKVDDPVIGNQRTFKLIHTRRSSRSGKQNRLIF